MFRTSLVKRSESSIGKSSRSASSDGSEIQPSIGIPLALSEPLYQPARCQVKHTAPTLIIVHNSTGCCR